MFQITSGEKVVGRYTSDFTIDDIGEAIEAAAQENNMTVLIDSKDRIKEFSVGSHAILCAEFNPESVVAVFTPHRGAEVEVVEGAYTLRYGGRKGNSHQIRKAILNLGTDGPHVGLKLVYNDMSCYVQSCLPGDTRLLADARTKPAILLLCK